MRRVQIFPAIYKFTVVGGPPLEWMWAVAAAFPGLRFLLKYDIPAAGIMGAARARGDKKWHSSLSYGSGGFGKVGESLAAEVWEPEDFTDWLE
jgi:hypothetical protein